MNGRGKRRRPAVQNWPGLCALLLIDRMVVSSGRVSRPPLKGELEVFEEEQFMSGYLTKMLNEWL
jgi:hypothetical protein